MMIALTIIAHLPLLAAGLIGFSGEGRSRTERAAKVLFVILLVVYLGRLA